MCFCRTSLAGIKSRSGSVWRVKLLKRWRNSLKRRLILCWCTGEIRWASPRRRWVTSAAPAVITATPSVIELSLLLHQLLSYYCCLMSYWVITAAPSVIELWSYCCWMLGMLTLLELFWSGSAGFSFWLVWFGSVQLIFMVMVMMCDALLGSSNLLSLVFTNNKHSSMACWRSNDPHIQLNTCRPSLCLFLIALPSLQLQKLKLMKLKWIKF